ncbi:MAG: hypothetical protein JO031_16745, partial [Ktedonobacteraceae bacterium]|nr:hypothetical protein [Ktedonobacteraceae bacterium]
LEAFETVFQRPPAYLYTFSPTLCHGYAGLLAICLRFAQNTDSPIIREQIPRLVEQVLQTCSPEYPLGVRDEEQRGNFVDDPGFLTGAIGVALTLLAAATPVEPAWNRLLLIA